MSQSVLSSLQGGVLTLTLNRPDSLNSASDELLHQLTDGVQRAASDDAVRVLVITGAGRGFCAGADLSAMSGRAEGEPAPDRFSTHLEATFNPLARAIRALEQPVITAVNGVAAGAGASLALLGDVRLWSSAASFIQVFSNIGLVPDTGASWLLPRLVGYNRAFAMMSLAEKVLPDEGLRLGLCEAVFPADRFGSEVQHYAERLAARPATALALTKKALQAALESTFDDALQLEGQLQDRAGASSEHAEGVRAFLEKRPANFGGTK